MTATPQKGPTNSILDIDGLSVGNASDPHIKTGVTTVICDEPTTAGAMVLGGAPGTRDLELLEPHQTVDAVDALVFSGGSAFGLDAASGVQAWLRENGRGLPVGPVVVPIVPGAILFDLTNGGDKNWGRYPPYRELAYQAAGNLESTLELGSVGAGTGATVAGLKGGLGSASLKLTNGVTLAALAVVNAIGSPVMADSGCFWAHPFERDDEFGGRLPPAPLPDVSARIPIKFRAMQQPLANTTIAVIATDALLSKAQAKRLAIAAHDGLARALWPVHTPLDGDLVFALATGKITTQSSSDEWVELGAHAAAVMARAIARAVYEATPAANDIYPTWKETFGG